ncbi:hypothetical protein GCM10010116_14730 [Microbispora rosea subsp. aerata]|nr:hypothetical protein GCM10010116_14730 [Microbispora rosea subsp. aerata]GIH53173.1 hypothetical protein Mro02_00870 [Microbispora rosea subsp. aerata]GLJ83915.1 hypothetical protein GCM10017588_26430 [Microbispora rosea subsp. aerata]
MGPYGMGNNMTPGSVVTLSKAFADVGSAAGILISPQRVRRMMRFAAHETGVRFCR